MCPFFISLLWVMSANLSLTRALNLCFIQFHIFSSLKYEISVNTEYYKDTFC